MDDPAAVLASEKSQDQEAMGTIFSFQFILGFQEKSMLATNVLVCAELIRTIIESSSLFNPTLQARVSKWGIVQDHVRVRSFAKKDMGVR